MGVVVAVVVGRVCSGTERNASIMPPAIAPLTLQKSTKLKYVSLQSAQALTVTKWVRGHVFCQHKIKIKFMKNISYQGREGEVNYLWSADWASSPS